jgi:hypothetical protein
LNILVKIGTKTKPKMPCSICNTIGHTIRNCNYNSPVLQEINQRALDIFRYSKQTGKQWINVQNKNTLKLLCVYNNLSYTGNKSELCNLLNNHFENQPIAGDMEDQLETLSRIFPIRNYMKVNICEYMSENNECSICYERMNNKKITTNCNHSFCKDCFTSCLRIRETRCAMCRQQVTNISVYECIFNEMSNVCK